MEGRGVKRSKLACVVANPSAPTKKQSRRLIKSSVFVLWLSACVQAHAIAPKQTQPSALLCFIYVSGGLLTCELGVARIFGLYCSPTAALYCIRASFASNPSAPTKTNEARRCRVIDIFFCFYRLCANLFAANSLWKQMWLIYQLLAQCSFCKGPHGEWKGKALSGASLLAQ